MEELKATLQVSDKAIFQNLPNKSQEKIVQIRKGFYAVLPVEYSSDEIIPNNMYLEHQLK